MEDLTLFAGITFRQFAIVLGVILTAWGRPAPVWGQLRPQFPSAVDNNSPFNSVPAPSSAPVGQTVNPNWDPYGDSAGMTQPALTPPAGQNPYDYPGQPPVAGERFLQGLNFQWTWLEGDNNFDLDVTDLELSASFAVPLFQLATPFIVTPGFAIHFWDGPDTLGGPMSRDLPGQVYDAYLGTTWKPQINPWLSADLGFRIGAYTDFDTFNTHSLRYLGHGLGIVTLSDKLQLAAGIVYLDRNNVKLLPAGGVIWRPDADTRYELIFPRPKLSHRITKIGGWNWWGYLAGEYGGGSWTIRHQNSASDQVDYNDLRFIAGIDFLGDNGHSVLFEVGYVFNRKVDFVSGVPDFYPGDTFMLRFGATY